MQFIRILLNNFAFNIIDVQRTHIQVCKNANMLT
jgi:hypothetical protein